MAGRAIFMAAFLLLCFTQVLCILANEELPYFAHQVTMKEGNRRFLQAAVDCGGLCTVSCGRHSRPNLCLRACGTCCSRCKCVPPGTHGNREVCGRCYTEMTTHGNKTKCP